MTHPGESIDGRYRCPACHNVTEGLWRGVTLEGWQAVDQHLKPEGTGYLDCEANWDTVESDGQFGCACGWEGTKRDLERIGLDGEPLPTVHPQQQTIEEAMGR